MEVSEELKKRVLEGWEKYRSHLERYIRGKEFDTPYVNFPILIDGVIDTVRYNVEERQFDQIEIKVATKGLMTLDPDLSEGRACYCDESETVIIPIIHPGGGF